MLSPSTHLLVLDLAGTFAFALDGASTAPRTARLDIVGVVALAIVTALTPLDGITPSGRPA